MVCAMRKSTSAVGLPNTAEPEPFSSDRAPRRLALVAAPRKVAMPEARPETPELIGNPVALVSTPADGVPMSPPWKYASPVPDSSLSRVLSCADDVAEKNERLFVERATVAVSDRSVDASVATVTAPLREDWRR